MVKILVIGDLHGQIPTIHFKDVDCILAPGDFCSDELKSLMWNTVKQSREGKKLEFWYDVLGKQKSKAAMNRSLKDGRKVLKYLDSLDIPVSPAFSIESAMVIITPGFFGALFFDFPCFLSF